MAGHAIISKLSLKEAIEKEKISLLNTILEGKFWVFRDEKWQIVTGKENVIEDIAEFALTIIDQKPGERRPFTRDGTKVVLGPADAVHNAMLDMDDIHGEVGRPNQFR
jgi:hypothetical protein